MPPGITRLARVRRAASTGRELEIIRYSMIAKLRASIAAAFSMITYVILKTLAELVLPPGCLAVGVVLWLVLRLFRFKRLAVAALALSMAETLVLAFPP